MWAPNWCWDCLTSYVVVCPDDVLRQSHWHQHKKCLLIAFNIKFNPSRQSKYHLQFLKCIWIPVVLTSIASITTAIDAYNGKQGRRENYKWIFSIRFVAEESSMSFSSVDRREIETSWTYFFSLFMQCTVLFVPYTMKTVLGARGRALPLQTNVYTCARLHLLLLGPH